MTRISRPVCSLLPLFLLLLLGALAPSAGAQSFDLQVVAQPSRLVFGGDNRVTLVVNVTEAGGLPAPDGTAVYFHTTLGTLPGTAYLKDGRVTVLMDNTVGTGVAVITVTVGAVRRTINVEYLGQDTAGEVGETPRRTGYTLKAHQVYYSVDRRVFDLRDQAQFIGANYTITAGAIQYSISDGALTAQQNVTLTTGTKTLTAHSLRMGVAGTTGTVIVTDPAIAYLSFTLPDLAVQESDAARQADYKAIATGPTKSWILCREASVYPAEYVMFRRPQFYVDRFDHKLYSLPYHVLNLRTSGAGLFLSSELSLTSDAGLNVDFPIYYAASPAHIGSLHLRNVAKGSSGYRGTAGLQVSLEEEYLVGNDGDGGLYLDDLTRETRSLNWDHYHDFGNTSIDINAAYERYDPETPYTRRLGLSVYNTTGKVGTRLSANWSALDEDQNGLAELTMQLPILRLGRTGIGINIDPYLGYQRAVSGATDTTPETTQSNFYQGVHTGIGFPSLRFLGGTISPSLSNEITRDQDGTFSSYLDGSVSYRRALSRSFSTSLTYAYSLSSSSDDTDSSDPNQRLSFDLIGRSGRDWNLYAYSTYNLDTDLLYHSLSTTYFLPWFRKDKHTPRCYASYRASVTSGDSAVSDQQMSLGWNIGTYAVVVHYSPTGNTGVTGIGTGSGKNWAIELVRQSF